MLVNMKVLDKPIYFERNGEVMDDGCESHYEQVEVPDSIVKEVIVSIFGDNYHISEEASKEIINDFDWWEELEDEYEDEIEERINEFYDINDLKREED